MSQICILADGIAGMSEPLSPERLAALCEPWAADIDALGAWTEGKLGSYNIYIAASAAGAEKSRMDSGGRGPDGAAVNGLETEAKYRRSGGASYNLDKTPQNDVPRVSPRIFICGRCSSSLDMARLLAEQRLLNEWDAVLAVEQTAGRGQLRRPWSSPAGNIYAAMRLPKPQTYRDDLASLVAGLLLAEGFTALGLPVKIKWPNDLLLNDQKIGGILLEDRADVLLAGIGLNVVEAPPVEALRDGWAVPAGSIRGAGYVFSPARLWRALVESAIVCYTNVVVRCNEEKLTGYVQEYLAWVGREVYVHGGDMENRPGRIVGVNERGALRLLLSNEERLILSGSLSLTP